MRTRQHIRNVPSRGDVSRRGRRCGRPASRRRFFLLLLAASAVTLAAQQAGPDLAVGADDLRIEQNLEGGYTLWIRRKPGVSSVLLTESTERTDNAAATYAYYTPEYRPTNGDERRILNGAFLPPSERYFLVDSTTEPDEELGEAFRVFVPYVVAFGYPGDRNGEILVVDGTFLSIRTFAQPFADYRGAWRDNPFTVRVTQAPRRGPPEGNFMPDTVETFTEISEASDGETRFSSGPEDTLNQIRELVPDGGTSLDLVLALDTTQSMQDDMPVLRERLVAMLAEETAGYAEVRTGLLLYRDYLEEYLVRRYNFVSEVAEMQGLINRARTAGGRDIPEAVHEALYAALEGYEWQADRRLLILVGDAPPHERPRGRVTEDQVYARARELDVRISTIILPQ